MFKKVYSFYPAFCTQPAFYSQSAVCILPLVRSLQSAFYTDRFGCDVEQPPHTRIKRITLGMRLRIKPSERGHGYF